MLIEALQILESSTRSAERRRAGRDLLEAVGALTVEDADAIRTRWDPRRAKAGAPAGFAGSSLVWLAWRMTHKDKLPVDACVRRLLPPWTFAEALKLKSRFPTTSNQMPSTAGALAVFCGHVQEITTVPSTRLPPSLPTLIMKLGRELCVPIADAVGPNALLDMIDQVYNGHGRTVGSAGFDDYATGILDALDQLSPNTKRGRRLWLQAFAKLPSLRSALVLAPPEDSFLQSALSDPPCFPDESDLRRAVLDTVSEDHVDLCESWVQWFLAAAEILGSPPYIPPVPIAPGGDATCAASEVYWSIFPRVLAVLSPPQLAITWPVVIDRLSSSIGILDHHTENAYWTELRKQTAAERDRRQPPSWLPAAAATLARHADDDTVRDQRPSSLFASVAPFLDPTSFGPILDQWCRVFDRLPVGDIRWHIEKLLLADPGAVLAHAGLRHRLARVIEQGPSAVDRAFALECVLAVNGDVVETIAPMLHADRRAKWWGHPPVGEALVDIATDLRAGTPSPATAATWAVRFLRAGLNWKGFPERLQADAALAMEALATIAPERARAGLTALLRSMERPIHDQLLRAWIRRSPHLIDHEIQDLAAAAIISCVRPAAFLAFTAILVHASESDGREPDRERVVADAAIDLAHTAPDAFWSVLAAGLLESVRPRVAERIILEMIARTPEFIRHHDRGAKPLARAIHAITASRSDRATDLFHQLDGLCEPYPSLAAELQKVSASQLAGDVVDAAAAKYESTRGSDPDGVIRLARELASARGARYAPRSILESAWFAGRDESRELACGLVQRALHDLGYLDGEADGDLRQALTDAVRLHAGTSVERELRPLEWVLGVAERIQSESPPGTVTVSTIRRDVRERRHGALVTLRPGDVVVVLRNLVSNARRHGRVDLRCSATAIDVCSSLPEDPTITRHDAKAWADLLAGRTPSHVPFRGPGTGTAIIQLAIQRNERLDLEGDVEVTDAGRLLVVRLRWDRPRRVG